MAKRVKIKQIKSAIGRLENQKRTVKALGLKKIGHTVEHDNTPVIQGMITTVRHLVQVEEV